MMLAPYSMFNNKPNSKHSWPLKYSYDKFQAALFGHKV